MRGWRGGAFRTAGDIHDKTGRHAFKRSAIKNFEGTIGFPFDGKRFEAGKEASFVPKSGGVVVIGMPSFQ